MVISESKSDFYFIGEKVLLRPLTVDDYETYCEVRNRCKDWLEKWEPTVNGVPMDTTSTKENFALRVHAFERGSQFDTSYGFGIFLHDGTFIGEVTLGTVIRGPFQSVMLGYWIDEKYAGRGLMPQAVALVVDYAFTALGFSRVEVAIVPRNKSSIRVVEKLGFLFEGISKEYIEVAGTREDHARYCMTYDMWNSR